MNIDIYNKLDESQKNFNEWKKLVPKDYKLYDSIYIIFLKWKTLAVTKGESLVGVGLGIKERDEGSSVHFYSININILVWYCMIVLSYVTIGENWVKSIGNLYITSYKYIWIFNYFKIKSLTKTSRKENPLGKHGRVTDVPINLPVKQQ